ncbi:MAG: hypothetical protein LBJ46_06830 [Planctomycetota bacterium]|jgi:flagellar biosynthesis protein FlhF|nr:hypothetical protein [Planctomycetota bacterium]
MAKLGNTHVFRAKTCTEAINKATAKLGKNIRIVKRRDVPLENLFSKLTAGKLGGDVMEVELEVEMGEAKPAKHAPGPKRAASEKSAGANPNPLLNKTYAKALENAVRRPCAVDESTCSIGSASAGIAGRLDEMKRWMEEATRERISLREEMRMLLTLQARGGMPCVPPEFIDEYRRLVEADIAEDLARKIVESVHEQAGAHGVGAIRAALAAELARRIPAAGPILPREGRSTVVALIGPTGAGKSTTAAKLAVDFTVRRQKTVGLINEDFTRPGADYQIRNLGQIMGLPVKSVSDPAQIVEAVRSMRDLDLVLIDTGGRSPRDRQGIDELKRVVHAVEPDETHLVLASGASERAMFDVVARFRRIGFDRLILTKLDEAVAHGGILNLFSKLADGLSYVTTGQKYMESLVVADSGMLARLVMGMAEVADGGVKEKPAVGVE